MTEGRPWRPRLRTILMTVNLVVVLIPLGSIYFLRIYENELVRQTESELIAQGAFIAAMYKNELVELLVQANLKDVYGLISASSSITAQDDYYQPILPSLDLASDPVLPRRPDLAQPDVFADPFAAQAGAKIIPILKESLRSTLAGAHVADYRGTVVSGSKEVGLSFAHVVEAQQALRGKYTSVLRQRISDTPPPPLSAISRSNNIRIFVAMPIILDNRVVGAVILSRSPRNVLKALYDRKEAVFAAAVILLSLAVLLASFTSHTITRPIHALIAQTKRIAQGQRNTHSTLHTPVTREIALLSENFSQMADTVQHRSDYIRNFAMHVSHEFKTPLTSIQGTIELLQEHMDNMTPEKRDRFLSIISQDTIKLNKLVARLLEMARADVLEPSSETTAILPLLNQLAERYKDYGLTISITGAVGDVNAGIAPEILETVITNLLDNSRQHGADKITIALRLRHDTVTLTLTDNGSGISSANAEKLFTPFFTTHRERGGTGLGLVIVSTLLQAHRGSIRHEASEQGAQFLITLPSKAI